MNRNNKDGDVVFHVAFQIRRSLPQFPTFVDGECTHMKINIILSALSVLFICGHKDEYLNL